MSSDISNIRWLPCKPTPPCLKSLDTLTWTEIEAVIQFSRHCNPDFGSIVSVLPALFSSRSGLAGHIRRDSTICVVAGTGLAWSEDIFLSNSR